MTMTVRDLMTDSFFVILCFTFILRNRTHVCIFLCRGAGEVVGVVVCPGRGVPESGRYRLRPHVRSPLPGDSGLRVVGCFRRNRLSCGRVV